MVRLDRIYTGGGDTGETSLGDGSRVAKDDARIVAMGDVDELNAALGLAILEADADLAKALTGVQNDLFDVGADLAVPLPDQAGRSRLRITPAYGAALEAWIDRANADLPPLTSFVLPGGTPLACRLHVARAACRRAERSVVTLARHQPVTPELVIYLNRLSDLLFVLSRAANLGQEPLWVPGLRG